jgi:hypothetical protein
MVENIPRRLRSEKKLFSYFSKLFPDRVHSASVVLNIPEVDSLNNRRLRVRRRLEKAVAYKEATGDNATHVVGRARCLCCGIESRPCIGFRICKNEEVRGGGGGGGKKDEGRGTKAREGW